MIKEKELNKVISLNDSEYIKAVTSDGGSVLIKKSDLYPVVTSTTPGLMCNSTYPLYKSFRTISSSYPAILFKTDIVFSRTSHQIAHLDVPDIISWNYANQIKLSIKVRNITGSLNVDVKDFSSYNLVSSVIAFVDNSNLLNIQINFKSSTNISNGYIVANCINTGGLNNHIINVEKADVYMGGKYSDEKLITL